MQITKHARRFISGVIAAILIAAFVGSVVAPIFQPQPNYVPSIVKDRVEMRPEASPEWVRYHIAGPDGNIIRTDIAYRDGSTGRLLYRADGTVQQVQVEFPDGSPHIQAIYHVSGRFIIEGAQVRPDGTPLWVTRRLDANTVVTLTFWKDGQTVFSEVVRDIAGERLTTTYFRQDGTKWYHTLTSISGNLLAESVYYDNGVVARTRAAAQQSWGGIDMLYYRPDGSLHFLQEFRIVWSDHGDSHYGPNGYYEPPPTLNRVVVYGADGTVSAEYGFNYNSSSPDSETLINPDGSRIKRYFNYQGDLWKIEHIDATGKIRMSSSRSHSEPGSWRVEETGDSGKVVSTVQHPEWEDYKVFLPAELTAAVADTTVDPLPVWQAAEGEVFPVPQRTQ